MKTIKFETEIQKPATVMDKWDQNIDGILRKLVDRVFEDTGVFVGCTISSKNNRTFLEGEKYIRRNLLDDIDEPSCESVSVSGYYNPLDKKITPEKWQKAVLTVFDELRKQFCKETGRDAEINVVFNNGNSLELCSLQDDKSLSQLIEGLENVITKQELEDMFR